MKLFHAMVSRLDKFLEGIAGLALVVMMLLTVADVALRLFGRPFPGTYEMVGFMGAVVIGLALPMTSLIHGHVWVDMLLTKLCERNQIRLRVVTRIVSAALLFCVGWNLIKLGLSMRNAGEVSPTLMFPFYPVAWGLGVASFVVCLTLIGEMLSLLSGGGENE